MPIVARAVPFLLGVLAWTLAEYALHRGVGHRRGARNPFSREHVRHHATVTYFAPSWKKALIATGILALSAVIAGPAFAIGFATMYAAYEFVHRRLHTHAPLTRYGHWARRHHLHHHFCRPHLNHGVTTPLWDWVFGTLEVPQLVRVPRRNALPWMLDLDGELRPGMDREYVLAAT
jgi:sterol desaturase/sphingolipid hydroxylase (fatty acid hydroxylase superfamily)